MIPVELTLCTSLQIVNFSNNKIVSLPKELSALENLRELYLSHNALKSTEEFDLPVSLKQIDLSFNSFDSIPAIFLTTSLSSLEYLNLNNNKITSLTKQNDSEDQDC